MIYFLYLALVVSLGLLALWVFQLLVDLSPEDIEQGLEKTIASDRVEQTLRELDQAAGLVSRQEVWQCMAWIWSETRLLAMGSGSMLATLYLLLFSALWGLVWLKTLLRPNEDNLRLLLGGELFMLVQVRRRNGQ